MNDFSFIKTLYESQKASQLASDLEGRALYPVLGVVTDINDPEGKRRIKAAFPSCPSLDSYWIRRRNSYPGLDAPLPRLGSTVQVIFLEGDPTQGYYEQVLNATNPPHEKEDEALDYSLQVPGSKTERVENKIQVSSGDSITIESDSGASIKINVTAAGDIQIESPTKIELAAPQVNIAAPSINFGAENGVSVDGIFWLNSAQFNVQNGVDWIVSGDMTINGQSIATLGAVDTDGDSLITKGW